MLAAYTALATLTVLSAVGARYELGASAQASYGTDWEELAPAKGAQLELVPRLALSYVERDFGLRLAYDPQLLMNVSSPSPSVLHRAVTSSVLRTAPGVELSAEAKGSYGIKNYRVQSVSLVPGPEAPSGTPGTGGGTGGPTAAPETTPTVTAIEPLPLATKLAYFEARGDLALRIRDSARLQLNASLYYLAHGGADAPSRLSVPIQRGPGAGVGIDWRPAVDHLLSTSVTGSYYTFVGGPPELSVSKVWTAELLESWVYSLTRRSRLRIGLGANASGSASESPRSVPVDLAPVAESAVEFGGGLRLAVRYGPFLDPTSTLLSQRVEAYASSAIPLGGAWGFQANASGARVVTGPQRGQIAGSAQVLASNRPARALGLFAALTGLWQRAGPDYPGATVRQISLVMGVSFVEGGRL